MKLTKERKVLLGVLALAGGILAVDRVLPGDTAEPPLEQAELVPAAPTLPDNAVSAPVAAPAREPLSRRLVSAVGGAQPGSLRDVFASSAAVATGGDESVPGFTETRRLTGVLLGNGRRRAILDGTIVSVGQKIDGMTLVSVDANSAVFRNASERVVLKLEPQPGGVATTAGDR